MVGRTVLNSVQISADGAWVGAASCGGRAMVWTLSGDEVVGIKASRKNLTSLAFSPHGETLATSGLGDDVSLWSLPGGVATIEVHSTIMPNPDAEPLQMGPIQLSYEISGEQQGSIELNVSTGWTIGAELKQTLAGEIKMGDTSWPISVDSTITMEAPEE